MLPTRITQWQLRMLPNDRQLPFLREEHTVLDKIGGGHIVPEKYALSWKRTHCPREDHPVLDSIVHKKETQS